MTNDIKPKLVWKKELSNITTSETQSTEDLYEELNKFESKFNSMNGNTPTNNPEYVYIKTKYENLLKEVIELERSAQDYIDSEKYESHLDEITSHQNEINDNYLEDDY